jgi:[NiFe] hydrogenase diaphorase moiety large subunit
MKDLVDKIHGGHGGQYDLDEIQKIGMLMRTTSHCGLGTTAANPMLDTLGKFPQIYEQRLKHSSYEPAFDLDAALQDARDISGRDDAGAHIGTES